MLRFHQKVIFGILNKNQLRFTQNLSKRVIEDYSPEHSIEDDVCKIEFLNVLDDVLRQKNDYNKRQVKVYLKEKKSYKEKKTLNLRLSSLDLTFKQKKASENDSKTFDSKRITKKNQEP